MEHWLWLSNERFTVASRILDGRVVEGPPLIRRFLGQPEGNLIRWMQKQPGYRSQQLGGG